MWLQPFAIWVFIRLFRAVDRHPRLMRALNALLRMRPVWVFGRTVLVTGDRQVRDVLSRDDDFPLPEKRADKFLTGAFILGMTRTPQFESERAELEHVIRRTDRDRIRRLSQARSEAAVQSAAARALHRNGREAHLDVVELSTAVGMALIHEYFGVRGYAPRRSPELVDDLRVLGAMVASPDSARESFRQVAEKAALRVFVRIDKRLEAAERLLKGAEELPEPATVLKRLVFRQMTGQSRLDRDAVRRNMIGVLLPGSALVTRAFATSLVQLLKNTSLRRAAEVAAAKGDLDLLEGYLMEALRFHPVFPIVPRHCPHETVLPGFRKQYRLRAGKEVFVSVAGAMFDPQGALFEGHAGGHPTDVRIRNPRHYRHFGGGIHECLGQSVALPQMAAMLAALLRLPHLTCGRIVYNKEDGISPSRLTVTFTPAPARAPAWRVADDRPDPGVPGFGDAEATRSPNEPALN